MRGPAGPDGAAGWPAHRSAVRRPGGRLRRAARRRGPPGAVHAPAAQSHPQPPPPPPPQPHPPCQRLDDLAHDHLVPHVDYKRGAKWRALLVNSWVLLLAAGILTITILSVDRLHPAEPLQDGARPRS